jgi:hypothetical protein
LTPEEYLDLLLEEEFNSFKDNPKLYFSFLATKLKNFYAQDLTRELIIRDKNGEFMEKVNNFISITSPESLADIHAYLEGNPDFVCKQFPTLDQLNLHKKSVLYKIFDTTPFFKNGVFDANVKYTSTDLDNFIGVCKKYKKEILLHLGIRIRSDLDSKPCSQVNEFLKLVGIETKKTKSKYVDQSKSYFYRLDPESLSVLMGISQRKLINASAS